MAALIFLRMTEDWGNASLDTITFYKRMDIVKTIIKMWDSRFHIRYFRYRSQVKDIALSQWSLPYVMEIPEDIGDDDWLVPSDDDDWFNPDLSDFLKHQKEEYVYWDSLVNMTSVKFRLHKWFDVHNVIGSNNYAIKGSLIKRANEDQKFTLLHNHPESINAARLLGAEVGEHKDKIFSCYNHHPGSLSVLQRTFEMSGMIKGVLPRDKPRRIPEWMKWIEPEYKDLLKVVGDLKQIEML